MVTDTERCPRHPGSAVVGTCDGCGEALCLACAVPVRGRVLGPVCLETELGDPPAPLEAAPEDAGLRRALTDLGLAATLLATVLPWSGVGLGAGPFGAWGTQDPRWASVVVLAATAGTAAAAAARWRARRVSVAVDRTAAAAAVLAMLAALLAIFLPPPYTSTSVGPWAAALGGTLATVSSITVLLRSREEVA